MNSILAIVADPRLVGLLVFGACVGSLLNLGVYRLAWNARAISPWSAALPDAPPRRWHDRIPILGWIGLRREAGLHGMGFWIRPMLLELCCGVGFAALYWWEIERLGLVRPGVSPQPLADLYAQFACHGVLISLMLVASLIDVDEKIIPDAITVPGTWFGLLAAAVYPWSLLPDAAPGGGFLRLTSPNRWPGWLDGFPHVWPLVIGLGCWWLWCAALTHRTWYGRHGWVRALQLLCARLRREPSTWRILLMGAIGSAGIAVVWAVRGAHWAGLLSALVGMVASGGIVWVIRVVAGGVLHREAMGFGDVTLMAMIGAFLGWQPCLIVFFFAPFAALLGAVFSLIVHRQTEIWYGPFLCLLALAVIVAWARVWERAEPMFALGWLLGVVLLVCLLLMVPLLVLMRLIRVGFGH